MHSLKIGVPKAEPAVRSCALDPDCPRPGFAFEFTKIVCKSLGLNCTFEWYHGFDFGDVPENDTNATGMLGAIQRGQFDTFVPVFTPTARRIKAVAFSDAYYYSDVVMITRQPNDQVDWGLLNPVKWPVWLCFLLAYLLTALVITVAIQFEHGNGTVTVSKSRVITYTKTLTALIICEYRRQSTPKLHSIRLLLGLWTLAMLVLTSAYTGVLFSEGVSSTNNLPFRDFTEFVSCLESGKCRMIANSTSTSFMQVLTSPDDESDIGKRILEAQKKTPTTLAPSPDIPKMVLQETGVYLVWMIPKETAIPILGGHECSYYIVDTPYKDPCAFAVQKDFPLLANFSRLGNIFRQSGLSDSIMARYQGQGDCGGNGVKQMSTWNSWTVVFYLYVIGMCSALLVCVGELGVHYVLLH